MTFSRNPIHSEILDKCKELHEKKSHDYAQDDNPFSNFEYAAKVADIFTDPVDKVFATLIGVKLARLAELRKGKEPKNESIEDTCIDFVNYAAIWGSNVIRQIRIQKSPSSVTMDGFGVCRCMDSECYFYMTTVNNPGHKHISKWFDGISRCVTEECDSYGNEVGYGDHKHVSTKNL